MSRPNNAFSPLIERIRLDVQCGGKLGTSSAMRLLDVLDQLASEVANLRRRLDRLTPEHYDG